MGVYSLIHAFRLARTTEQHRYKVLTTKKAGVPDEHRNTRKFSFFEEHMEIQMPDGRILVTNYEDISDSKEGRNPWFLS